MNLAELDIAILCGGKGTRMRSVLGDLPKALAPINGKPLLEHLLEYLRQFGAKRIILCVGVGATQIEEWRNRYDTSLEIIFSFSLEPKGEVEAINQAIEHLKKPCCLVLNGDTLLKGDLRQLTSYIFQTSYCVSGVPSGVKLLTYLGIRGGAFAPIMVDASWVLSFIDCGTPEGYARAQTEWV